LRFYAIDKDYQATEIDAADAAGRFIAWLADAASPVLGDLIQTWLWQPRETGGLGVLADSESDVAVLRAEIVALCQRIQQPSGPDVRGVQ